MFAGPDVLVVLVIALVVFGGKRISDLGTGLGKGIRNFKKGMEERRNPFQKRWKTSLSGTRSSTSFVTLSSRH